MSVPRPSPLDRPEPGPSDAQPDLRAGAAAALGAYGLWGVLPLFFKLLEGMDALAIVAHRVVFSLLAVLAFVFARGARGEVRAAFRDRKVVLAMIVSTLLIAVNWLVFVYGVTAGRVLEVSFGYFINPLVSVALGLVLLGERFSRLQGGRDRAGAGGGDDPVGGAGHGAVGGDRPCDELRVLRLCPQGCGGGIIGRAAGGNPVPAAAGAGLYCVALGRAHARSLR